jgi:pimeloyl-ACP methyl ester carboxylesterase
MQGNNKQSFGQIVSSFFMTGFFKKGQVLAGIFASACVLLGSFPVAQASVNVLAHPLGIHDHSTRAYVHRKETPARPSHRLKAPTLNSQLPLIKSGLNAYDTTPLGTRTPLILIHGIGGDNNRLFDWVRFLRFASQQTAFAQRHKIYLYHYDSCRSVPIISQDLQRQLTGFIQEQGGRPIKILAYSEGGLLTRNALQDPYLNEHVQEVLAIATPFHGSPLANPAWMRSQIADESIFSLVRIGIRQAYAITGHLYPDFQQDFHWDNFDGALTAAQMDRKLMTGPPVDYALAHKQNFITYGSFFGMDIDPGILKDELSLTIPLPKERPSFGNLFKKNLLFSLIRNNIGRLPLAKAEPDKSVAIVDGQAISDEAPASLMMFNDGISPISSSLWLGRYLPSPEKAVSSKILPASSLWAVLRSLRGKNKVRLFAGLDHRNWMDGNTRTGKAELHDLLNPDGGPHNVFEWILHDLMS